MTANGDKFNIRDWVQPMVLVFLAGLIFNAGVSWRRLSAIEEWKVDDVVATARDDERITELQIEVRELKATTNARFEALIGIATRIDATVTKMAAERSQSK